MKIQKFPLAPLLHRADGLGMPVRQSVCGAADDTAHVPMLRYFEHHVEVKQAVSVFKKRPSHHERTMRQFSLSSRGMEVGDALRGFRGILTGVPVYEGKSASIKPEKHHTAVFVASFPAVQAGH